ANSGNPAAQTKVASGAGFPLSAALGGNDVEGQEGELRSFGGRVGRNFALERSGEGANVFDAAAQHVRALQAQGKRVVIAAFSPGARERLLALLGEHHLANAHKVESFGEAAALPADAAAFAVLGL